MSIEAAGNVPRYSALGGLLFVTFAIYSATAGYEFVAVDDPQYVLNNLKVQAGFTADGIRWAFSSVHAANWHPLTWLSHMADIEFYRMWPGGHHLTSVLLHVINTALLWLFLFKTTGEFWKSLFAAALFALHPLHVESVAWISERKDVLSTLLFLLTLLAYSGYVNKPSVGRYGTAVLLFALGLMAKPMLVTLPLILVLLDWWPFSRLPKGSEEESVVSGNASVARLLTEKIPFLLLSILSGFVTIYAQQEGGALEAKPIQSPFEKVGGAFTDQVWYLWKTIWPTDLAFFYPQPEAVAALSVVGSAALVLGITLLVVHFRKAAPFLVTGWLWFVITLLPVIGIVAVGMQDRADRYSYIPSIGLFIMFCWQSPNLVAKWRQGEKILMIAAFVILIAFTWSTWRQVRVWENSLTLAKQAVKVTDRNYMAHNMLADALDDAGKTGEAIPHYQEALKIMPTYEIAHNSLGVALVKQGDVDGGMKHFRTAVVLKPRYADVYVNMGATMAMAGRFEEAATYYREALRLQPDDYVIADYLNQVMGELGRKESSGFPVETLR